MYHFAISPECAHSIRRRRLTINSRAERERPDQAKDNEPDDDEGTESGGIKFRRTIQDKVAFRRS